MANLSNINNKFLVTTEGNVGINTTSPDSKLDVTGGDITVNTTGTGFMNFKYSGSQKGTIGTDGIDLKITANADLQLLPQGNVGIGTTSPANKLTVSASNTGTQITTNPVGKFINTGNSFSKLIVGSDNNNFDAVLSMDNNSTLANTKLRIYIGNGTNATTGHSNDHIVLQGDGNVGIGTTTPSNKLDVKISTSNRTTLEPVLTVSAEGNGPYTGFGPKISFNSNIYYGAATGNPAGIIETAYIGAVMGTTYATNSDLVLATRDGATSVTEKMRILGNGNVGIGTTSPVSKLHVVGEARVYTGSSLGYWGVDAGNSYVYFGTNTSNYSLSFQTSGTERMRIDSSGNAIFTKSGGAYLQLKDASAVRGAINVETSDGLVFTTGSSFTERMRINSSGNVGIGTTMNINKLDVAGNINVQGGNGSYLTFNNGDANIVINNNGSGKDLSFKTYDGSSNSERMRIDKDGRVGIGLTNPTAKLQVVSGDEQLTNFSGNVTDRLAYSRINSFASTSGTTTGAAALELVGNANGSGHGRHAWIGAEGTSSTNFLTKLKFKIRGETNNGYAWAGSSEAPTIMTLQGDGNVGIGTTSPLGILQLNVDSDHSIMRITAGDSSIAGIDFGKTSDIDDARIRYYNSSRHMEFFVANGERMRIDSSGNVGIGTTSLTTYDKLQVIGHAWIGANATQGIRITNNGTNASIVGINQALAAYQGLELRASGTNGQLFLSTNGNVGIGETSPDFKLHVKDTQTSDASKLQLRLEGNNGNYFDLGRNYNTGDFEIQGSQTGANNILLAPDSGQVGIGKTPSFLLDLKAGTSTEETLIKIQKGVTGDTGGHTCIIGLGTESSGWAKGGLAFERTGSYDRGKIHFLQENTGNTDTATLSDSVMTIDSSGNVGISTDSPNAKLEIGTAGGTAKPDALRISNAINYAYYWDIWRDNLTGYLNFGSATGGSLTTQVTIKDVTGDVGIGVTNPSAALDVQGTSALFITRTSGGLATYIENDGGYPFLAMYQIGAGARVLINTNGSSYFNGGAVGIGTTAPFSDLSINVGANAPSSSGNMASEGLTVHNASGGRAVQIGVNESGAYNYIQSSYVNNSNVAVNLAFFTGASERMRITSGGRVDIGTRSYVGSATSTTRLYLEGNTPGHNLAQLQMADYSAGLMFYLASATPASRQACQFYNNRIDSSPTFVGSIQINSTATAFNTSSDYRLKENVVKMTGALDRVSQLKPSRFNFIGYEEIVDGFLAHEVSDIVPEAISGTKDEVDNEGNPVYQGIDQSKLVPLLVGAIQELKAEIELLKNK